jgi:Vacuolar protein sorting-associated protein 62
VITPIFRLDSGEKWRPQPVETVEHLAKIGGQPVKLSDLPEAGGRMDFPSTMVDPTDTAVAGYHRVVEAADLWWHQYWLWYLYNPWEIAGIGRHEGDWEFVQLASVDAKGKRPVLMTASQHKGGEKREFWRCELAEGRPVVYVALGSHANYFTPGTRGEDQADGHGRSLPDVEWREFGEWAAWPGMWGNSTGAGHSPDSPGNQGDRWFHPHLYHAASR